MEWYYWIAWIVGIYFSTYITIRIIVKIRRHQNKDPYRSEYYGR